jgi:hypothetical protein
MSTPIPIALQREAVRLAVDSIWNDATERTLLAAVATLETIDRHKDGLRILILHLREQLAAGASAYDVPDPQQTRALLAHPAVRELVETFPDLTLYGTAPVTGGAHGTP